MKEGSYPLAVDHMRASSFLFVMPKGCLPHRKTLNAQY